MFLRQHVPTERLKWRPKLSEQEKSHFHILSRAYRLLRASEPDAAKVVRDRAIQILRVSYHRDHDAMFRHSRLNASESIAVVTYFSRKLHPGYAADLSHNRSETQQYLRLADRTYENVEVIATPNMTDFAIIGREPGRDNPSLLARMHRDGGAAPTLHEITAIVVARKKLWNGLPLIVGGMCLGVIAGLVGTSDTKYASDPDALSMIGAFCALLGMAAGVAVTLMVNHVKRKRFYRQFPHLAVRC